MEFTRQTLERAGFVGWVPLTRVRDCSCPMTGGVYVVSYPTSQQPAFMSRSCGGWFKGKDPTVMSEALRANWVENAEFVYVGKAEQLRRRLTQFADFGAGKPVGHWGGRLVWQLPEPDQLVVAWKETPGSVPSQVEAQLINDFRRQFGKPPFANDPHRLGA